MNQVLKEILETGSVNDWSGRKLPVHSEMDAGEGELLSKVFKFVRPETSLEVGMAYGISTLFICDALASVGCPARHIVIDPFQSTQWEGIGFQNIKHAGYERFVELREEKSEIALPRLLSENTIIDVALIDGWHTFDHALVDFFYINKMLRVGGIIVIDDASWPSVSKVVDHVLTYGCYRMFAIPDQKFLGPKSFLMAKRLLQTVGLKKTRWPSAVALEKTRPDTRSWDWHRPF